MLPLPNLDDRRWLELVEEGRNLIPRYAPEWTDFNLHDPGITLIELFAWLAEMDIYWLNRIPPAHRREFMALLGIPLTPRAPRAAQTIVQFSLRSIVNQFGSPPLTPLVTLPETTQVEAVEAGRIIRFRTLEPVTVVPTHLREVWREDEGELRNMTSSLEAAEPIAIFGEIPRVRSVIYFGFSEPLPVEETVTLYLRFAGGKSDAESKKRLQDELSTFEADCLPSPNFCQCESDTPVTKLPDTLPHHSVSTVWEFAQNSGGQRSWQLLDPEREEVSDETRTFTLDGFVRFRLPQPMATVPLTSRGTPLFFMRCRFVAGEYDAPPILSAAYLNATTIEQAIPVGSEFVIAKNAMASLPPDSPPIAGGWRKFTLAFNAVQEITRLTWLEPESAAPEFFVTRLDLPTDVTPGAFGCELRLLGEGLGEPAQKVVLNPVLVQSHSVSVFTLENDVWQNWIRRPDFDASSRSDRHFLLDETTGAVVFGDGENGLPVPRGALIFARFHTTFAEKGNLLAGRIAHLSDSAHNEALIDVMATREKIETISNPLPATGGAEAETILHAQGRVLEEVRRVTRAVTISDIEHLALTTPGTNVARAAAKANIDARYPCLKAPGMITVIILPRIAKPGVQPSAGLRAAVQRYLNRRRIIGSRIEVVGPAYTTVTVKASVQSQASGDATRVQRDILRALSDFFDHLHGGPEKTGWPFGRDVYRSEVLHTIDSVPGVENVISLALIANSSEPSCGNLCIGPCGLVISGDHEIVVK